MDANAATKAINDKYTTLGGSTGSLGAATTGKLVEDAKTGFHIDYKNGSIYWSAKSKKAYAMFGAILQHWISLGGPKSSIGYPTTDENVGVYKKGRWNTFENKAVIVLAGAGVHCCSGPIYDKYMALGGPGESRANEFYPTTDVQRTSDGVATFQQFSGKLGPRIIYLVPKYGAVYIRGDIYKKWMALGGPNTILNGGHKLGYPVCDQTQEDHPEVNLTAHRIDFICNTGMKASIYELVVSGSNPAPCIIYGQILNKWLAIGGPTSRLNGGSCIGYPSTDELGSWDGARFNKFSSGAAIYWHPKLGSNLIYGQIYDKWMALGGPEAKLSSGTPIGYPNVDETGSWAGARFNTFNSSDYKPGFKAAIYWTARHGAVLITGPVYDKWKANGGPEAQLNGGTPIGYPIKDEQDDEGHICRFVNFSSEDDGGVKSSIYLTPRNEAVLVYGQIYDKWMALGGLGSFLSYPITDETSCGDKGGRYNDFLGGSIYWSPKTGPYEHKGPLPDTLGPDCFYKAPQTPDGGIWLPCDASTNQHVQFWSNGTVRWWGNIHADGAWQYSVIDTCTMTDADGQQYQFAYRNTVGGYMDKGDSEDHPWDISKQTDSIRLNWRAIVARMDVAPFADGQGAGFWGNLYGTFKGLFQDAGGVNGIVAIAGAIIAAC
ncbi:hypothetical protein K432DRAFT_386816 [Lepidopterella palustris CBS 459.81]|uniref:Uncharacterized protein n=1 Tax=Lepidopterella palustris CBS 459.81 TaxID=1314670 RepID=A0A8E2DZ57_9PEZI|nr:hypothetical protein K432DRAFT_386816 [Lepidopterella palustris CBS 459.81]